MTSKKIDKIYIAMGILSIILVLYALCYAFVVSKTNTSDIPTISFLVGMVGIICTFLITIVYREEEK